MRAVGRFGMGLGIAALLWACSDDPPPAGAGDTGGDAAVDGGVEVDATVDAGTDAGPDGGMDTDGAVIDDCNPLLQSGCPGTEKCVVEAPANDPGARCLPTGANDKALGQPCTGADCQAGLACIRTTTNSTVAACVKVCDRSSGGGCEGLPGEWECRSRIRNSNWGACVELPPACDHLTQAPCAPSQACQPLQRFDGSFEFRCLEAGPKGDGELCGGGGQPERCQRGMVCVRNPQTNESNCRILCDTMSDCPNQRQCSGSLSTPAAMFCGP